MVILTYLIILNNCQIKKVGSCMLIIIKILYKLKLFKILLIIRPNIAKTYTLFYTSFKFYTFYFSFFSKIMSSIKFNTKMFKYIRNTGLFFIQRLIYLNSLIRNLYLLTVINCWGWMARLKPCPCLLKKK